MNPHFTTSLVHFTNIHRYPLITYIVSDVELEQPPIQSIEQ